MLICIAKDKESHTNSTTHHGRDLGIGFSLGLGTGGFGVGASIALGHHSRPQTSSSTPTHNPEVISASPLQRTSGSVSITRPGTGASIVTGSSVKTNTDCRERFLKGTDRPFTVKSRFCHHLTDTVSSFNSAGELKRFESEWFRDLYRRTQTCHLVCI